MKEIKRRVTRVVKIGRIKIGGSNPIALQSMAKAGTADSDAVICQIRGLEAAGCDIVRVAVKDIKDARALRIIKNAISIPLVADIHFDWRLAIAAIESGVDKIRLNPGNIFRKEEIRNVVAAAKAQRIPIRIGVNSGSVRRRQGTGYRVQGSGYRGQGTANRADAMVRSAIEYVRIIEGLKFNDLVLSLKGSDIFDTLQAYRKVSKLVDYPLHLGVTATGLPYEGALKSSIALGALLLEGIGDTIRVSLTDDPQEEIRAGKAILQALNLRKQSVQIISCPTCGRCEVNLVKIVKELENKLTTNDYRPTTRPVKLAVMGCVVNGPGEAKDADIGVAFGKKEGLLFKKGKAIRKVTVAHCSRLLLEELKKYFRKA